MRVTRARLVAPALILALTALGGAGGSTTVGSAREEPGGTAARTASFHAYGELPLSFVPNAGQLGRRVRYAAQAGSASVFLTRREAVVALARGKRGVVLRLGFLGANARPTINGQRRADGRVSYLLGSDPARWHRNLPTYEQVVYGELWRGVEMRIRGEGGQLKYEFRLAPGADPSRVRLAYRGQERLSLGRGGMLRIKTALGVLHDTRPVSYQPVGGRRVAVESRFVLGRGGAYGFALGKHDPRFPLVIDPGLTYSTFLGNGASDIANGTIAVDGAGNAYVTGSAASAFPTTSGAFDTSFDGGRTDAFVTKLSGSGSSLVYSTYLGGDGIDRGWGIALDAAGSAYVTGATSSADFPTTPGSFDRVLDGAFDAFAAKLNPTGSALTYSTYLGGGDYDRGGAIALDSLGSAYVTGSTRSADFPTTPGAFDPTLSGGQDTFVTKLSPAGSLAYSTHLGGSRQDLNARLNSIAVDSDGSAYVTGSTTSTDFPTTPGAFDRVAGGNEWGDGFVTKLNAEGSALAYSTYLNGHSTDAGLGIAVDSAGSAYVTGYTESSDFPTTPDAFDTTSGGGGFVTKIDATGSALVYSTYLRGARAYGIAVDSAGSAYVTGDASTSFPTTDGAFRTRYGGGTNDAFVTKLNAAGSALAYSTFVGGSSYDWAHGIALDSHGNAYVTGTTHSTDFPSTTGAFDTSYNGGGDTFVTKLDLLAGPPGPLVRCRVPRVIGMKLTTAKRNISVRHCKTGRVRSVRVGSRLVARVVGQNPGAGKVRAPGFRVKLTVGRR